MDSSPRNSAAPAFASVTEAMDLARAALGYLAAADATALAAATQAECLRGLEQTDAISTAVRACFLSAFTAGQGYSRMRITARGLGWCTGPGSPGALPPRTQPGPGGSSHPTVVAALAAGELSESYGRTICVWTTSCRRSTGRNPTNCSVVAAAAGLDLRDLGALFAEMYERAHRTCR